MNRFDAISPLDYRYYGDNPEFFRRLQPYASESGNIQYLLKVELALIKKLVEWGACPHPAIVGEAERACQEITPEEVYEEEKIVHHNIRAVVNCIRKRLRPEFRSYVHLFATSADIMDTASALRFKELVRDVVLPDLIKLQGVLIDLAKRYSDQVQIGRTHGQHAVPVTFGFSMALYVSRLGSRIQAIDTAQSNLRGMFSGAAGAFNALSLYTDDPASYEMELLADLGLKPSDTSMSSQIVEPESLTDLAYAVVSAFSVLANLADDMRNLIRSEIAEVLDKYSDQEVGSSTMPHKMNPKNFENVKSLWKEFMPRMTTVFMDQISEHQRDLTNSASGRFLPELFTGFCYAIERMSGALAKIEINPVKMQEHVDAGKHHVAAEPLYILLALAGHPNAYDIVMKLSREARRKGVKLLELAKQQADLYSYFEQIKPEHQVILEDPARYVGDASGRTQATCEYWENISDSIQRRLQAEAQMSEKKNRNTAHLSMA